MWALRSFFILFFVFEFVVVSCKPFRSQSSLQEITDVESKSLSGKPSTVTTFENGAKLESRYKTDATYFTFVDEKGRVLWTDKTPPKESSHYTNDKKIKADIDLFEGENAWALKSGNAVMQSTVILIPGRVLIVNQYGEYKEYNKSYSYWPEVVELSYKKTDYILAWVETGEGVGDVFLIDSKGENSYLVAQDLSKEFSKSRISENGICSFVSETGRTYRIDIEALEIESKLTSSPTNDIEFSETTKSSHDWFHENFEYYESTARRQANGNLDLYDMDVIETISEGLTSQKLGGAAILGKPGAGKSQLIDDFIVALQNGAVDGIPRTYRFVSVNVEDLVAGKKYIGSLDSTIKAMLDYSRAYPHTVWVFDEAHLLATAGKSQSSDANILQMLKKAMGRGKFKAIFMSTTDEFDNAFKEDPAFLRRLARTEMKASVGSVLEAKVRNWMKIEGYKQISKSALERAIELSDTFSVDGVQPSGAIRLLEAVFAKKARMRKVRTSVTVKEVEEAAKAQYGLGDEFFDPKKKMRLMEKMEQDVESKIFGLEEIKQKVYESTYRAYGGLRKEGKPHRRMLFAGPPGSGKTHFAKVYANSLGAETPVHILCAQFIGNDNPVNDLLGEIAKAVRANPMEVIILDEIEKVPVKVQNALLSLLDSGELMYRENGRSRLIKVTNAAFLLLTNAGDHYIDQFQTGRNRFNMNELKRNMIADGEYPLSRPLIDRLQVEVFFPPNKQEAKEIVEYKVGEFIANAAREYGIEDLTIKNKKALVDSVLKRIFSEEKMTIREAEQYMESLISGQAAKFAIFNADKCGKVSLNVPIKK